MTVVAGACVGLRYLSSALQPALCPLSITNSRGVWSRTLMSAAVREEPPVSVIVMWRKQTPTDRVLQHVFCCCSASSSAFITPLSSPSSSLQAHTHTRGGRGGGFCAHVMRYGAYCCDCMNVLIIMHVCGYVGVQLGGRCCVIAMGSGYISCLVSCACIWLAWLFFGCVLCT